MVPLKIWEEVEKASKHGAWGRDTQMEVIPLPIIRHHRKMSKILLPLKMLKRGVRGGLYNCNSRRNVLQQRQGRVLDALGKDIREKGRSCSRHWSTRVKVFGPCGSGGRGGGHPTQREHFFPVTSMPIWKWKKKKKTRTNFYLGKWSFESKLASLQ